MFLYLLGEKPITAKLFALSSFELSVTWCGGIEHIVGRCCVNHTFGGLHLWKGLCI